LIKKIKISEFIEQSDKIPMVDVRSPGEFEHAHIPGAFNIPLFDNQERAAVGTTYKQVGRGEAVKLGLQLVGPKMRTMAESAEKLSLNKHLLVHCWRGGMRSESMAWLFRQIGLRPILLDGGYKSFRQFSKRRLAEPIPILILSGSTGSGKTHILKEIGNQNQQILDLEGIAHHKGSAFGGIGEIEQNSNEQFENNLFWVHKQLDLNRVVWIEDESKPIGRNYIPDELYLQMREAMVVKIEIPFEERLNLLEKEYTFVDKELLIFHLNRIKKRLGPKDTQDAIKAVQLGDMRTAIAISLKFYDKAYAFGISQRNPEKIISISLSNGTFAEYAKTLIELKKNSNLFL
jgi:tRNA 2-selenouridine synthase